jgi:predicted ATPase/DNA-binding winged helix-turn-helix (wHTH) protein
MNDSAGQTFRSYAFGPFVLIPERQQLLRKDVPVRVGGRALDLLTALVERAGEVVSKRDLMSRVWSDLVVDEGNLKVNMAGLRRALGECPEEPYIATVSGRGYRFVAPVRQSGAAGPVAAPARAHNLPVASTRIVGRSDFIDRLQAKLEESRLVSIVGAGGIGKTTVALAAAEHAIGTCRDGVWLIELAPVKDAALVPSAVATAIGLTTHSANVLATLCEYLRRRELLLVLDSCEHLVEAVAACADRLLADAAGVRILATSREPLMVKGERVLRLPGLDTPPAAPSLAAADALAYPAVELFVERATDRLESFRLSDTDAPAVAEICRRLDGLALAIELAATRVDAFGVGELLVQLGDRLQVLRGPRGGAERHRTLTATIDWSYQLLSDAERAVMRRLAVFAGVFGVDSACAVAGDGFDRATVLDALANLVAKSLLTAEVRGSEVDYRLLDTTRAYALDKLASHHEVEATRRHHAVQCLRLAEPAGLVAPRTHIDDLRAALAWAFGPGDQAALGVRLTVATIPFWKQLSLVEECRAAVERALGDRFVPIASEHDTMVLRLTLGITLLHTRGPMQEVKSSLSQALETASRLGDVDLQLACLRGLSEHELWSGDSRASLAMAERIRALALSQGRASAGADADAQASSALWYLGDLTASRRNFENIIQRPVPVDLRSDSARFEFNQRVTARGNLASLLWLQGFPDRAVELVRRQREEAEASGQAVPMCYALLHGSAVVSLYVHDLDAAGRFLDMGEQHAVEHGLTVWRAMAICLRCRWHLNTGKPFDFAGYEAAMAELRERGFRIRLVNYMTNYGEAIGRSGDPAAGVARIDEAMAMASSQGNVGGIPEMLRIKGDVLRLQGPSGAGPAADCYLQSIDLAQRQGALSWELRTAMSLTELWREVGGDTARAEALLAAARARFTEGHWTGDLRRAHELLEGKVPGDRVTAVSTPPAA